MGNCIYEKTYSFEIEGRIYTRSNGYHLQLRREILNSMGLPQPALFLTKWVSLAEDADEKALDTHLEQKVGNRRTLQWLQDTGFLYDNVLGWNIHHINVNGGHLYMITGKNNLYHIYTRRGKSIPFCGDLTACVVELVEDVSSFSPMLGIAMRLDWEDRE